MAGSEGFTWATSGCSGGRRDGLVTHRRREQCGRRFRWQQVRPTRAQTTPPSSPASPSSSPSLEDDFASTRSIAAVLHRRYTAVVESGYRLHLKDFARASITAYAVGCTEEGLRKELIALLLEQQQSTQVDGDPAATGRAGGAISPAAGSAPVDVAKEVQECLIRVAVVFVTIHVLPQPIITRWSTSPAASPDSLLQWKGFCTLITKAYYDQGMAWYSVGRLQMEQMASCGQAEPAAVVSDRMRLVFTTLEVLDPRWGGLQDFPTL